MDPSKNTCENPTCRTCNNGYSDSTYRPPDSSPDGCTCQSCTQAVTCDSRYQILNNGVCNSCNEGQIVHNNECVSCGAGEIVVDYKCHNCGTTQVANNNQCVNCGSTQIISNYKCTDCGYGTYYSNGECLPNAASGGGGGDSGGGLSTGAIAGISVAAILVIIILGGVYGSRNTGKESRFNKPRHNAMTYLSNKWNKPGMPGQDLSVGPHPDLGSV